MVDDVLRLRELDFSKVKLPRYDYADQIEISQERVDLMTACAIHYGLNTGMVVRYLKGEYVGESRDANCILEKVSPYIDVADRVHIKRIINQGCPISKKIMITNTWSFGRATSKPFFNFQKSPREQ
jgi:hypothetical protein